MDEVIKSGQLVGHEAKRGLINKKVSSCLFPEDPKPMATVGLGLKHSSLNPQFPPLT